MAYSDKLLSEVNLRFRDAYKNVLEDPATLLFNGPQQFKAFDKEFPVIHDAVRAEVAKSEPPKPRTFQVCTFLSIPRMAGVPTYCNDSSHRFKESHKSKKTVASMIEPAASAEKVEKAKKIVVPVDGGGKPRTFQVRPLLQLPLPGACQRIIYVSEGPQVEEDGCASDRACC